jgi:Ser/Thr protein kinase RdoA (MazF antagonist)
VACTEPAVLADGANVIVHLRPAPVVAKVAASTREVRPHPGRWLQRELDLARWLHDAGQPVAEPSPEVPATVHHYDGQVMTFWRYLPPAGDRRPDETTFGTLLRDLHQTLRAYPKQQRTLAPLQDIPAFLARPGTQLTEQDKDALAAACQRLTAELDPSVPAQPLHGDAGPGNILPTPAGGWVWLDLEDTCTGPVAWDLAASTASPRLDPARILAGYGVPVDARQLAVCQQLRRLHLTVWYQLYAERLPGLRPRAAELLAQWPRAR